MTRFSRLVTRVAPLVACLLALTAAASAQSSRVTQTDVQKLQDSVYLAERDITQLRARDAARASQLQAELDELGDEVIYLRVKLRKERTLAQSEYNDVQSRIEDVRTRARGDARSTSATPTLSLSRAPNSAAENASTYTSRASETSNASRRRAAANSSGVASVPRLEANAS